MNLAIIPARGGSKRIPRKNVKPFAGRPIIGYSIDAARTSGLFDRIVVSTDCVEIAALAREAGAETPFLRPAELADDFATTAAVVDHALDALGTTGVAYICCIYPTAPFLEADDLRRGFDLIVAHDVLSVVPVTSFPSCIFRALGIDAEGRLRMFWPENRDRRSNDFASAYRDAGQFYWLRASRFRAERALYGADSLPLVLPRHRVHDIDTPEDWRVAELVYNALHREPAVVR